MNRGLGLAIAIGLLASACTSAPVAIHSVAPATGPPGGSVVPSVRLVAFDSCDQALSGWRQAALATVGPYGWPAAGGVSGGAPVRVPAPLAAGGAASAAAGSAPAAPAAGATAGTSGYSGTNVQEAGVDEPDLVKTDGRRIVTAVNGTLRVVDAASRRVTGTLALREPGSGSAWGSGGADLLLSGDRALVFLRRPVYHPVGISRPAVRAPAVVTLPGVPGRPETAGTEILLVDLAGTPRLVGRIRVDGQYVDARQVGATVRLVARSNPPLPFRYPTYPGYSGYPPAAGDSGSSVGGGAGPAADGAMPPPDQPTAAAVAANRQVVRQSTVEDWLPHYAVDRGSGTTRYRVPCTRIAHPSTYTGASMLTVYTVNLARPAPRVLDDLQPVGILADGEIVYGTGHSLYVAANSWGRGQQQIDVHRFDLPAAGPPRYAASGRLPGALLGQYALSEHDGYLRVATTTSGPAAVPIPPGRTGPCCRQPAPGARPCCPPPVSIASGVHVLAQRGGALVEVGHVGGLGAGERIYAVRFVGDIGYVVTFRQIDPLYTIDLSDPRRPRVAGQLTITGYSAYLHPIGARRLLGVGQDATSDGHRLGTQVSLFDVGDPAHPVRLASYRVPGDYSSSPVESDPHAFLYSATAGLVVLPIVDYPAGSRYGSGALALSLAGRGGTGTGITGRGTLHQQDGEPVDRALIVDQTVWTLSTTGLQARDLHSLADRGWIPLL